MYLDSFAGINKKVQLLALVMLINRSGMMVLPFLTIYATDELGLSIIEAGYIAAGFGVGSICGSYFGGILTDVFGGKKVLVFSLAVAGIILFSLIGADGFWELLIGIFSVSLIADMSRPATFACINSNTDKESRTRSVSLIRMAINLGISIGPALGGYISGVLGYKWLFILDGGTCIGAALFFWIFAYGKFKDGKEEKDAKPSTSNVYKDSVFLYFLFFNLINLVAFFQILSTLPLFLEQVMNLNEVQIGLCFTLNGLIIFLFEMPIVAAAEKKKSKLYWVTFGALLIALGSFSLNLPGHWLFPFLMYSVFIGIGEIYNFPFSNTMAMARGEGKSLGRYMGMYTTAFSISIVIAPILGTYIIDQYGFQVHWNVMGLLGLISVMGFMWLRHTEISKL